MAVAGALLCGCARERPGEAGDAATPAASTATATAAATHTASTAPQAHRHHRPYSDVNPPPRRAGDFVVTVLVESTQAIDGPARPGHRVREEVWSEKVRTCVRPSSRMPHVVGWSDWRAVGIRGHRYPADPRAARPPRGPAYPLHRTLSPGECATGYWSVVVPERAVRAIQLAPGGGPALIEWLTLR